MDDALALDRWSFDDLVARFPDAPVGTLAQRSGPEASGEPSFGSDGKSSGPHYKSHNVVDMDLVTAFDAMGRGAPEYVAATAAIFGHHPELLDEVGVPTLRERLGIRVIRPELFAGMASHRSYYHCALGTNVFVQVTGEKDWTLVHPHHTPWMAPNIGHSASGLFIASPIQSEAPDIDAAHPLYRLVPKIELRTGPGDVLINPSWWWHEVRNRSETLAVALRTPSIGVQNPLFSAFYFTNPTVLRATRSIVANAVRNRGRIVPDTDDGYRRTALYSRDRL